jgi:hypothetical protein
MKTFYIVFACSLLALAGCNNTGSTTNKTNSDTTGTQSAAVKETTHSKLSDAGTAKLMTVLTTYYSLKNALVATKSADAGRAATKLTADADSMQAWLQTDSINKTVLKPYLDTIISQSKVIASLYDETCEKHRLAFGNISSAFYGLLKHADVKNAHTYHTFCPMAFNDKGAFWLSEESDVKNPYFGKKMLECGEVTDSL